MKREKWIIILGFLFIGNPVFSGDGDLLVNGKLGIRTTSPTGIFEIAGQVSGSGSNVIPTMTSYTVPSGVVSADSEITGSYPAWMAMDHDNSSYVCWVSSSPNYPHWLQYQFSSGKIITSYSITSRNYSVILYPSAWKLQGSNNGNSWTDLDSRSGVSFNQNEKKNFTISDTNSYSYYRLYITAGNSPSLVAVGELELIEASGTQTVSLFYVDESTGNVGIRSTSPGNYQLYVNGAVYASSYAGSDKRWKKNITPINNGLSLVEKLQGVRFEWRTDEFKDKLFDKGTQIGLIAQEVEPVIPEIVKTDTDGYKAISYEKLTAVLVEAIKEQNQQIKKLEARIKKLEKKKNN